ncbi:MAG TPA: hypothetical protein VK749_15935 [Xanthobacteraceae bacterium]|jgi:hypothetical protein|nr:hypothetical protein [Xanthobacteraceae bacterium]
MTVRQNKTLDEAVRAEAPEWGPAMLALPTDRQRAFVAALYDDDAPRKGDGLLIFAAAAAGYGTPTSSKKSLSVIANRIVHDDRVQAAIAEFSQRSVRIIPPEAVRALKDLIRDPTHKDHARGIAMVLDRVDPLQTMHTVKVEDNRPPTIEATQKVLDRIDELMQRVGLAPAPKVVDGECRDVTPQEART